MRFVTPENKHLATPEAVDLMDKLLRYDHVVRWKGGTVMYRLVMSNHFVLLRAARLTALLILTAAFHLTATFPIIIIITTTTQERLTAQEAMAHPFFDAVRKNREAGGAAAGKAAEGSM